MEEFYPSEIARLVLGYLKDVKCLKAWETFLEECSDLDEHSRLYKEGKFCSTNVNGKSLVDVLKEYCALKRDAVIENNQNKFSKNTYEFEVLKTPSKANENAFATFRINQKFQSQSVVSSHIPSPSARSNLFRTPPSRSTSQTPRRRLECQATPLNFGPEADSVNQSHSNHHVIENVNTSLRTPVRKRNSISSTNNTCFSDSVLTVKSKIHDRNVQNYVNPNFKSHQTVDTRRNQAEHVPSTSAYHPKSSKETDIWHTNASGQNSQNEDTSNSNTVVYSTPKEKIQETFDYSDLLQLDHSISASEKQNPQTGENSEEGHSSVLNKSFVYQSSEITANGQNITMTTLESCFTPQYSMDPPPYNRAPLTNSPRIILSHDRSLIPSLTTPVKDTRYLTDDEWSPRRKGSIPRRRLITESPLSKYMQQSESLSFESMLEYMYGNEEDLTNNPLVQLLTDNINKVKQNEILKEHDGKISKGQDVNVENIVKNATELIEEDPVLGKYFAVGSREESNFNSEPSASKLPEANSTDCEMETFSENTVEKNNDPEKPSKDVQNENTSQSVQNAGESDLLGDAFRETFGEITTSSHFGSSNLCPSQINENNHLNSHETFTDVHGVNVCTNTDTTVNSPTIISGSERKNGVPDNDCVNTVSCDILTNNSIENRCNEDSANNKSDLLVESETVIDSATVTSMQINTPNDLNVAKNNLEINSNENVKEADLKNGLQSNISTGEINQTSLYNTSVITSQATSSAVNLETSTNPCATTVITPQIPSQPVVEFPFSLPYFGIVQNGVYRIIINSPLINSPLINTPLTWNTTPVGGMCAPVSTIPAAETSSPLILNPAPLANVPNVENVQLVNSGVSSGNIGNFATSTIAGNQISPFINTQIQQDISVTPQVKTPPKKNQRNAKRKNIEKRDSPQNKRSNKEGPSSSTKRCKRPPKKRNPKRKPLCLFPSSPKAKSNEETPNKNNDTVPVLSIPDTPSLSGQSSAFKLLSQITGQFEREERSPVLKMLMSNAATLSQKGSRLNSSHVRCLDFESKAKDQCENNELQTNNKKGKSKDKDTEKSPVQNRRSLRIQQSKEKQNQSNCQEQNKNDSSSVYAQALTNKRKRSLPKKRVQSNNENSTIDMTAVILSSMEEARQHAINAKERNSEYVLNKASTSALPSSQTFLNNSSDIMDEEVIKSIDLDKEVLNIKENDYNLATCVTVKDKSIADSKVNDSPSQTDLMLKQIVDCSSRERIENLGCENSVHSVENVVQEETALLHNNTKSSTIDHSKKDDSSENIAISEPLLVEPSHSQTETKNVDCNESLKINTTSSKKEDTRVERTKKVTNEQKLKDRELSNYLFGSDVSSDESNVEESSNNFHQKPASDTNVTDKGNAINQYSETKESCRGEADNTLETEKSANVSSIGGKYPVINKENSIVSNVLSNQKSSFLKEKTCDQFEEKSKLCFNDEEMENALAEKSEKGLRNSTGIFNSKRRIIAGNSLSTEQNATTELINTADNIIVKPNVEISDSSNTGKSFVHNKSFCTSTSEARKKCQKSKFLSENDNCDDIESDDLPNLSSVSDVVEPINASEGNSNIVSLPSNCSLSADNNNEHITNKYDVNQSLVSDQFSNIKGKYIANISDSSISKQSPKNQKNEVTYFKKSQDLLKKARNKEFSNSRASLEQNQKKRKRKSRAFQNIIVYGRPSTSDLISVEKQKAKYASSSSPHNVNLGMYSNIKASQSKHSPEAGEKNLDQTSCQTDIYKNKKNFDKNKSPKNFSGHKIINPCNLVSRSNPVSMIDATKENSSLASKHSKYSADDDMDVVSKCIEVNDSLVPVGDINERGKSICTTEPTTQEILKDSSKNQEDALTHFEKPKNFQQEGKDHSKVNESSKASDLLLESVDLTERVSDDLEQNVEILSHNDKKIVSSEKGNQSGAGLGNADKQARSARVENQMMSSPSSSTGHNKNVYSNIKTPLPKHSPKSRRDSPDHTISFQSNVPREKFLKGKSPKNSNHEILKNQDLSSFASEFETVSVVDGSRGNSSLISKHSDHSGSAGLFKPSRNVNDVLTYSEKSKNQLQRVNKANENSKALGVLPNKDLDDLKQNKGKSLHTNDKKELSEQSKKIGSQMSEIQDKAGENMRLVKVGLRSVSSSGHNRGAVSSVQTTIPRYLKETTRKSLSVRPYHSKGFEDKKNKLHCKSRRYSDNYEISKASDRSRYDNDCSRTIRSFKGNSNFVSKHCSTKDLNIRDTYQKKDRCKFMSDLQNSENHIRTGSFTRDEKEAASSASSQTTHKVYMNSEKSTSRHSSVERKKTDQRRYCSTGDVNIRDTYYKKSGCKNVSDLRNSEKRIRTGSFTRDEKEVALSVSSQTTYKMNMDSEISASRHSLTERKRTDQRRSFHSKKSAISPKTRNHVSTAEKSENLKVKEKEVRDNFKTSNLLSDNLELVEGTKITSDRETALLHNEVKNISYQNNKTTISQDSLDFVNAQAQVTSNVNMNSDKQSDSVSNVQNVAVVPNLKSCTVSEGTIYSQSDDSLSSISSKEAYHEANRVRPPFKKRIRPIPVKSPVKTPTPFSPFWSGQEIAATDPGTDLNLENSIKRGSFEKDAPSLIKKRVSENTLKEFNVAVTISNPEIESLNNSTMIGSPDSNSILKTSLPNPSPVPSLLVTPIKEARPIFATPVKVVNTLPMFRSPISKSQISNPTTPSPKIKSTFRSPYPQSGKPKSMEYFYRTAFPDKNSDLPISPLSFSNSSCTADAFSARRQLLEDESCSQSTNAMHVEIIDKAKDVVSENSKNAAENQYLDGCNNEAFDKNETGKESHQQELSSELNENHLRMREEQEISESITSVCKYGKGKEDLLSCTVGRKRKISESLYSDTCSTVVDCSDLELMTPEKNDWLNKPLFSKEHSPVISKKKKLCELSSSSDVTPTSSPEKGEIFKSPHIQSSSHLFPEKSPYKTPATDTLLFNSSTMQKIHTENVAESFAIQKSIIDEKKLLQSVKTISNTNTASHKSLLSQDTDQRATEGENESPSGVVTQDSKLNLLLSKIQIYGLDNILDRLKDK